MSPISSPLVLMLLSCVVQARASGRPPSCSAVSVRQGLPDRVVNAGTMFRFHLPPLAFQGPIQHYQVSLVDYAETLPKWLVYSAENGTLQGLALREEGGEYTIRVMATGRCKAYTPTAIIHFHLRILSDMNMDKESTRLERALPTDMSRSNLGCPVGEAVTSADLVLHVDPICLGATERLKLVTTLSDYLHVPSNSVTLLSFREPTRLRQENTTILAMSGGTSRTLGTDGEGLDREQPRAEILWAVGCGDFEKLPDLVQVLQHSTDSGYLSILLGVPVGGWRVLQRGTPHRARRPRQLCQTPTPTMTTPPPVHIPPALRPPFVEIRTMSWQGSVLTQAPGMGMASQQGPSLLSVSDFQQTVSLPGTGFLSTYGESLWHTIDPPDIVSPVPLPGIVTLNTVFSIGSQQTFSALYTTEYLAKIPAPSSTDSSHKTWPISVLLDPSQSAAVFPLISQVTQKTASVTSITILPTQKTPHGFSSTGYQTLSGYDTTRHYPDEFVSTSRNFLHGFYPTRVVSPSEGGGMVDFSTEDLNSMPNSESDLQSNVKSSPEQTLLKGSTSLTLIKLLETLTQFFGIESDISELLPESRTWLSSGNLMTVEQQPSGSTHNIQEQSVSSVFSAHLETLNTLYREPKTSVASSTVAHTPLTSLSLFTWEGDLQQPTTASSIERTSVSYTISPAVPGHTPSESSTFPQSVCDSPSAHPPKGFSSHILSMINLLAQSTEAFFGQTLITPPLEWEPSKQATMARGGDPSSRVSLGVQQTSSSESYRLTDSPPPLLLTPLSQSETGSFVTDSMSHPALETSMTSPVPFEQVSAFSSSPELPQKTPVTLNSFLQASITSSLQFELEATITVCPQCTMETVTVPPQFPLKASITSESELGSSKTTKPTQQERSFTTYSQLEEESLVTSFPQFDHSAPISLQATSNLVTGSMRHAASLVLSDNNITTPLSTLKHSPVTSSLVTREMTESAAAHISEGSSQVTALLDYHSAVTSVQSSEVFGIKSSSSTETFSVSPTIPYSGWIYSLLHLDSLTTPMQDTPQSDMTVATSPKALNPQSTRVQLFWPTPSQSPVEWLISDSVTALSSGLDISEMDSPASRAPPETESVPGLPLQTHQTPQPPLSDFGGRTQTPWPSYSGEISEEPSLDEGKETLVVSLTETPLITTHLFMPYTLSIRSHISLSPTPHTVMPTAEIHTDNLEPLTVEFPYAVTSYLQRQSLDTSYPFSSSDVSGETEVSSLTSYYPWSSPADMFESGSLSLQADLSPVHALRSHSVPRLTEIGPPGGPVTPVSIVSTPAYVPPLSQSLKSLLSGLFPTISTKENDFQSTTSILLSPLGKSSETAHSLSLKQLSTVFHDKQKGFGVSATYVQQSSPGSDVSELSSAVSLSPRPVLTVIQATTHLSDVIHITTYLWHTQAPSQPGELATSLKSSIRAPTTQPDSLSTTTMDLTNIPPAVLQSIPALEATVGMPFHYSIPSGTFFDPEDREANTQLTLEIFSVDGSPSGPASWVRLDQSQKLLHGVPLDYDMQFSPQQLVLIARDTGGLTAQLPLSIELRRATQEPCHAYVLTARNSLHSFLQQRQRVELFLDKLAHFFNDSSASHLSLLSLKPGSTVVAWYNLTLCQSESRAQGWCPESKIRSTWVKMMTEDGWVNPAFSQAMLPEFLISEVGKLTLGGACLHRTPEPTHPTTATTVATTASTPQYDLYPWTARLLTALLILCFLFLIVILSVAVLRSCKRCRTLSLRPSEVYPTRHLELRALKPRMPPLFQEEVPPPPLQLWLNLTPSSEGEPLRAAPTIAHFQHHGVQQRSVPSQPPPRYQLPPPYAPQSQNYKDKLLKTPTNKYKH